MFSRKYSLGDFNVIFTEKISAGDGKMPGFCRPKQLAFMYPFKEFLKKGKGRLFATGME